VGCRLFAVKVSPAKLKKFEKDYSAMKEQQEDPLERLQVVMTTILPVMCVWRPWMSGPGVVSRSLYY